MPSQGNNNRSSSSSSDLIPIVASIGLFIVTTAVSQWAQQIGQQGRSRRRRETKNSDSLHDFCRDDDYDEEEDYNNNLQGEENDGTAGTAAAATATSDFRDWYENRRVKGRLSYENLQNSIQNNHLDGTSISSYYESATAESAGAVNNGARMTANHNFKTSAKNTIDNNMNSNNTAATTTSNNDLRLKSEWDFHRQITMKRKISASAVAASTSSLTTMAAMYRDHNSIQNDKGSSTVLDNTREVHPNAHYDFHPKNKNWRHFEHFNIQDIRDHRARSLEKIVSESQQQQQKEEQQLIEVDNIEMNVEPRKYGPEEEGESSSSCIGDDAQSISSDGSASSEEQFVWMKHNHRTRESDLDPNVMSIPVAWPERIKRRVSSTLAELFVDPNTNTESDYADADSSTGRIDRTVPLHIAGMQQESSNGFLPPHLASKDTTVRHRNSGNRRRNKKQAFSRRTMSSPNLMGISSLLSSSSSSAQQQQQQQQQQQRSKKINRSNTEPPSPDDSCESSPMNSRMLRAHYNAQIMPDKLVLIRHGQSMGNVNESLYSTTPDNSMPLTDLGWKQARAAGKILKDKILGTGQNSVHFIVSPYVRTVETFHGIASAWCDPKEFNHIKDKEQRIKAWYGRLIEMGLTWNEDSRIREQDFGNYQDPETIKRAKHERHRFGVFYYRFPHGESASDVFDRVSTFLDSLWRSFEMNRSQNYVLVTHGISIRVLLARYFRYTIDQFNMLANPRNCEMVVLGHNDSGKLELEGRCALEKKTETNEGRWYGDGCDEVLGFNYKFHKRLRILPRNDIRKVRIRISPDDK